MTADISLTSAWTPLAFNGFFDGNGTKFVILRLIVQSSAVGFFSTIDSAVITNLNLSGELTSITSSFEPCSGGLAGSMKNASLTNVTITMDITVTSNNGVAKVGGVAGESNEYEL